jgi:hypothetical protein
MNELHAVVEQTVLDKNNVVKRVQSLRHPMSPQTTAFDFECIF